MVTGKATPLIQFPWAGIDVGKVNKITTITTKEIFVIKRGKFKMIRKFIWLHFMEAYHIPSKVCYSFKMIWILKGEISMKNV